MAIKQQRGAALILALVILSIVIILAAAISSDFLLALRKVENQLHSQQAYAYLRGAEVMARQVLQMDFNSQSKRDHFSEGWLENDQEVPIGLGIKGMEGIGQGVIKGRLSDLQGRFNLNRLAEKPASGQQYTQSQLQFTRLLQLLPLEQPLDPLQAEALTRAVSDWVDADNVEDLRGGAETLYYADAGPPMRAGNKALISVSELLWVKGMSYEIYTQLRPFVAALPGNTLININTASAQLIQAMVDNGTGVEGTQLVSERDGDASNPAQGFETMADFDAAFARITGSTAANAITGVDIKSEYFLLSSQVLFLDRQFELKSVLHRDANGIITVYARSYTDL